MVIHYQRYFGFKKMLKPVGVFTFGAVYLLVGKRRYVIEIGNCLAAWVIGLRKGKVIYQVYVQ